MIGVKRVSLYQMGRFGSISQTFQGVEVTPPLRDQRSEHETEDFCSTSSSLFGGLSTSKIRHLVTDAYQPAE